MPKTKKVKKSTKPIGTSAKGAYPDLVKPEGNHSGFNTANFQGSQGWENYEPTSTEANSDIHNVSDSMRDPLIFEGEEYK